MATPWSRYPRAGLHVAALLLVCSVAVAHHGVSMFDRDNPIVVSGVVREFRWTSPHAWILIDVPASTAAVLADAGPAPAADPGQWAFEGASIAVMVRNGWKSSTLRPGDHVRILAAPRRDGSHGGEFLSVTLTGSGRVLQLTAP